MTRTIDAAKRQMMIEQGNDTMTTVNGLARYDQSRLLTGNILTGIGVEVDRRAGGLLAEAALPRPAADRSSGLRRRLGHGLIHLGEAVSGREVRHAIERTAPAR